MACAIVDLECSLIYEPSVTTFHLDPSVGSLEPTPSSDPITGCRSARLRLASGIERLGPVEGDRLIAAIEADGYGYVGVDVAADKRWLLRDLQQLGFGEVEQQLTFTLRRLHRRQWPNNVLRLEVAGPAEVDFACELAATAFHYGRYHSDPVIERSRLAHRYPNWIRSLVEVGDAELLVMGAVVAGALTPVGFLLTDHNEQRGQLLLGATDLNHPGPWGLQLYQGALMHLQDAGCRSVTAVAAVDNTPVLNVLIELGFSAGRPTKLLRRTSADQSERAPQLDQSLERI